MEYKLKTIQTIVGLLIFLGFVVLVVVGQKQIGYTGLSMMLAGLAGIILCLWVYNKKHR